jgi:hypothetical protein
MLDLPTEQKDAQGRTLTFRKLNALEQSRVVRAAGDHASNQAYMTQFVYPAASVAAIDGVPMPLPQNLKQIDSIIGQLDDDGMDVCIARVVAQLQDAKARMEEELAKAPAAPLAPSAP